MRQERQSTAGAMLLVLIGLLALTAMAGIGFASIAHRDPMYGLFIKDCVENRSLAAAECDALYEAQQDVVARKSEAEYSSPAESGVK